MTDYFMPSLIYFAAAAIVPFIAAPRLRATFMLAVPFAGFASFATMAYGTYAFMPFFDFNLKIFRLDGLSFIFGLIFSIAAFISIAFAWHIRDRLEQVSSLVYAGAAIGAVFAGDLITLFVFWEGTAIASALLIWARRTPGAIATTMRYFTFQIASGLLLFIGIVLFYRDTGSVAFQHMELDSLGTWLIFLAFGFKCAFPLMHNWLQDAYPAATPTGTVTLSAFTTKLAIYALARGFAGTEFLIYIGAAMSLFPVFFAAIENNLRRVLAYSLNNQLGFMVVGIGIGTPLALDGTVAHAFVHVIYKALLFMSVGAVIYRTGTAKVSDLGGLWKYMPWTMAFCIVGSLSISAFPLFSGFVAKSLILSATASSGHIWVWMALVVASVGVLEHAGIKIPYSMFFGHDRGWKVKEAPLPMLLIMGFAATLCVLIGVFPQTLYALLPYPVEYEPYTADHVITQLQMLFFAALAFALLIRFNIYPAEYRSINLDFDWVYRRFLPNVLRVVTHYVTVIWRVYARFADRRIERALMVIYRAHGPQGALARTWPTGSMVLWIAILLGITLGLAYL
ncbi:MAG: Na(+)/H(+) antiporter subunit D [Parvibaculum sp.]|nr:Na(+)/H(+) antiporter subunit D [Parvibaculum sp.]